MYLFICNSASRGPGWLPTLYAADDGLELLTLLLQPQVLEQHARHTSIHAGMEARATCTLGKHYTN